MAAFDRRNNTEKRNFMRIATETSVEVLYEHHTLNCTCKDLSATGLQINAPIPLKLDTEVTICIKTSDKLPPFRALATITRQVPAPDSATTYGLLIDKILE